MVKVVVDLPIRIRKRLPRREEREYRWDLGLARLLELLGTRLFLIPVVALALAPLELRLSVHERMGVRRAVSVFAEELLGELEIVSRDLLVAPGGANILSNEAALDV